MPATPLKIKHATGLWRWGGGTGLHWGSPSHSLSFPDLQPTPCVQPLCTRAQTVEEEWSWVPHLIGPAGGFRETGCNYSTWIAARANTCVITQPPLCFSSTLSSITHYHSPIWASEEHLCFSSSPSFNQFNLTEQNGGCDIPSDVQVILGVISKV